MIVLVVSTEIEPAFTVPSKVTLPSSLIFPLSIFVVPETVFEPLNTIFATYASLDDV